MGCEKWLEVTTTPSLPVQYLEKVIRKNHFGQDLSGHNPPAICESIFTGAYPPRPWAKRVLYSHCAGTQKWQNVQPYFDVQPDAPLAEFVVEAPRHPVFLLQ